MYLLAIWKEGTLERSPLETGRQTGFIIMMHVIVHSNSAVSINIAFLQHGIDGPEDF